MDGAIRAPWYAEGSHIRDFLGTYVAKMYSFWRGVAGVKACAQWREVFFCRAPTGEVRQPPCAVAFQRDSHANMSVKRRQSSAVTATCRQLPLQLRCQREAQTSAQKAKDVVPAVFWKQVELLKRKYDVDVAFQELHFYNWEAHAACSLALEYGRMCTVWCPACPVTTGRPPFVSSQMTGQGSCVVGAGAQPSVA